MGRRRGASGPMKGILGWAQRRSEGAKAFFVAAAALLSVVGFALLVRDYDHLYVASEAVHAAGILVLFFKLARKGSCAGLSLKSQELTALVLAVRLYFSFVLEKDIHTILDFATLIPTLWVICMIRFKLKSSYVKEFDSIPRFYLVVPSILLAILIHPFADPFEFNRILWAFCVYLESVSVLPQLRFMQNAKMVEPFTAHYVFALGVARFLGFADWIFRSIEARGAIPFHLGTKISWLLAASLSEIVQTFVLADFCYYYVKRSMFHQVSMRLPMAQGPEVKKRLA